MRFIGLFGFWALTIFLVNWSRSIFTGRKMTVDFLAWMITSGLLALLSWLAVIGLSIPLCK